MKLLELWLDISAAKYGVDRQLPVSVRTVIFKQPALLLTTAALLSAAGRMVVTSEVVFGLI